MHAWQMRIEHKNRAHEPESSPLAPWAHCGPPVLICKKAMNFSKRVPLSSNPALASSGGPILHGFGQARPNNAGNISESLNLVSFFASPNPLAQTQTLVGKPCRESWGNPGGEILGGILQEILGEILREILRLQTRQLLCQQT